MKIAPSLESGEIYVENYVHVLNPQVVKFHILNNVFEIISSFQQKKKKMVTVHH